MKYWIKILVYLSFPFFFTGCCEDCDKPNNVILKIQIFEKNTQSNITGTLDPSSFWITQLVPESPVLLPALEFKGNEILAEFPLNCQQIEYSSTMEVIVLGKVVEKMLVAVQTTTKSCCGCPDAKGTIKTLTVEKSSKVNLGLNSNTLRIEI
jgi:hypothetical protein